MATTAYRCKKTAYLADDNCPIMPFHDHKTPAIGKILIGRWQTIS